jgi:cytochrome c553
MKIYTKLITTSILIGLASIVSAAGDAAAGKGKAALCAACHGADGISPNDLWPNLKGQKFGYLVKQMKALRDGSRSDPMMSPMAAPLSDEDIDDLAAYFSSM